MNERTHMLAALSHDLRSPLTAMRLRIEMLDETEDSIRLRALVEEMQAMVEATLEFARGVAKAEPAATVDLAALLGDLVGDVGEDRATLAPSQPLLATIRPQSDLDIPSLICAPNGGLLDQEDRDRRAGRRRACRPEPDKRCALPSGQGGGRYACVTR